MTLFLFPTLILLVLLCSKHIHKSIALATNYSNLKLALPLSVVLAARALWGLIIRIIGPLPITMRYTTTPIQITARSKLQGKDSWKSSAMMEPGSEIMTVF